MKAMLWKELRENFKWAVLAMIGLAVMAVRWSVGRDRLARTARAAEAEPADRPRQRPAKDDR